MIFFYPAKNLDIFKEEGVKLMKINITILIIKTKSITTCKMILGLINLKTVVLLYHY